MGNSQAVSALTACCSSEKPSFGADIEGNNVNAKRELKSEGPDEWTDTSMDWSRTDTSLDRSAGGGKKPSFRNMSKQDYLSLYGNFINQIGLMVFFKPRKLLKPNVVADGIHALLTEKKIGREQENELYELIGKVIELSIICCLQCINSFVMTAR
jgi:hypothetical protein